VNVAIAITDVDKSKKMEKVIIAKTEEQFDIMAAMCVIKQIQKKPNSVIGLSTGRTTAHMHQIISEFFANYPSDLHQVTFFGVDEVMNVPRDYSGACFTMLKNQLIDALSIDDAHFLMLPTQSDNFSTACREFEQVLIDRGGADLLVLGLGENGHLGFNQPGTPFESCTCTSRMDEQLETRIRRETNTPPDVLLGGVTIGLKNIMHCRKILLVAKGSNKAEIVEKMLHGAVTPQVPASILQLHPDCHFLFDLSASKYLQYEH
jgi:glucosamine-6-phosphate deaminase